MIVGPYLIKVTLPTKEIVWYWAHQQKNSKPFSPVFRRKKDAEEWLESFMRVYSEMNELIDRAKNGQFYSVKAIIDSSVIEEYDYPPFSITINADDGTISTKILAKTLEDARNKFSQYFEVIEWIE